MKMIVASIGLLFSLGNQQIDGRHLLSYEK